MAQEIAASGGQFAALVVVSPMQLGDETKDQDRACWFELDAIAALCDGTTSSPFAAEAAELVARAAPVLLKGAVHDRLRVLSDLLMSRRREAMQSGAKLPPHLSPGLERMLQQAVREARAQSYQTTLVAAAFIAADGMTIVELVCCGDSAFFAFSPDSGLLMSSLVDGHAAAARQATVDDGTGPMTFAPGDELMAKVLCDGADRPRLLQRAGIPKHVAGRWLICRPLDKVQTPPPRSAANVDPMAMRLSTRDLLLVPKYLTGNTGHPQFQGYCRFPFSRMIRRLSAQPRNPAPATFSGRGCITAVLPDHFYSGSWRHIQERFPPDTHFVLASDGFYGSFTSPEALCNWLRSSQAALHDPVRRDVLLAELHAALHSRGGDDDISFVWVFPVGDHGASLSEPPRGVEGNHAD